MTEIFLETNGDNPFHNWAVYCNQDFPLKANSIFWTKYQALLDNLKPGTSIFLNHFQTTALYVRLNATYLGTVLLLILIIYFSTLLKVYCRVSSFLLSTHYSFSNVFSHSFVTKKNVQITAVMVFMFSSHRFFFFFWFLLTQWIYIWLFQYSSRRHLMFLVKTWNFATYARKYKIVIYVGESFILVFPCVGCIIYQNVKLIVIENILSINLAGFMTFFGCFYFYFFYFIFFCCYHFENENIG